MNEMSGQAKRSHRALSYASVSGGDESEQSSSTSTKQPRLSMCKCKTNCRRCNCVMCNDSCKCNPDICSKRNQPIIKKSAKSQPASADRGSRLWNAVGVLFSFTQQEVVDLMKETSTIDNLITELCNLKIASTSNSVPAFCICLQCCTMPTEVENVCCEELPCITDDVAFTRVCLDTDVLKTAIEHRNDLWRLDDDADNATFRHYAYRQYIYWKHGYLGKGRRIVCPACVVKKIREKFPSPAGFYTGFKVEYCV